MRVFRNSLKRTMGYAEIRRVQNAPLRSKEGHTGVLQRVEDDSIWVKLHKHFPELNEWDNEV